MIFRSPRQALAYLFAAQRGPGLARPKWHDAPRTTGNHHLDHVEIGAMLYGPRRTGGCGIVMGSKLEADLREWATERGVHRSDQVLAIERRLRCILRAHGVLPQRTRFRSARFDCGDGSPSLRAVGFEAVQEKPVAALSNFCS